MKNICFFFISGHGVDKLLDDNLETYWQSDGPQPHLVNIQFKQKTKIKDLCIFSDFKVDESYTPQKYLFSFLLFLILIYKFF
jgi:hypothetical protein